MCVCVCAECVMYFGFVGFMYMCVWRMCYIFWVCVYNVLGILISCFLFVTVMVCVVCKSVSCIARFFHLGRYACKEQNC